MRCRHCGWGTVNRPRGLCWSCYYKPGIRDLHPSTSKFAYRGIGNFNRRALLPSEPTDAQPGTLEKILILQERARQGLALWHPADAPLCFDRELAEVG